MANLSELENGDAFPGIDVRPDVCGGEPCIVRTRTPVWLLEQARRLGTSEQELVAAYPSLRAEDLVNAWAYARSHAAEIEAQIRDRGRLVARLYSNENIAIQVVMELRHLGHDVLTSFDAGNANAAVPYSDVLAFAVAERQILLTRNGRPLNRAELITTGAGKFSQSRYNATFRHHIR